MSKVRMMQMAMVVVITSLLWPCTETNADEKVGITARFSKPDARINEHAVLEIEFQIPDDFHLYSMTRIPDGPLPLKIDVPTAQGLTSVTEWFGAAPIIKRDPNFEKAVEYYDDTTTYRRVFKAAAPKTGRISLPIKVKGQICSDEKCIPFRESVHATLDIDKGAPRAERETVPTLEGESFAETRPAPSDADITDTDTENAPPLGAGLIGFILIAFLAGLGALVTPCVFPMIPITVSFFSKFAEVSIRRSVTMASVYAASIVTTFTLMGVLVSAIFGAVGMQTLSASAGFNIFLTLLLVVFAFNLFGLFEIQMPGWLVAKTSEKERSLSKEDGSFVSQAAGVFFMAVTFTLVSFTCTVGFIGVVLAEAAKGNWFYPAVGMLAFSLAFSLPFFVLAVFPSIADKLRGKGGDWMVAVKVVLGFLELASAFKFLSNVDLLWGWGVITRPMVLAGWTALFAGAGLYLLRMFNLPHSDADAKHVGPIRMMFAVFLFALAIFAASGVRDTKSMGGWLDGWLPPAVYPGTRSDDDSDHLEWIVDDISEGRKQAKDSNRPLFIDFTGYTCTNCRYMEGAIFPRAAVRSRLERMVRVTAYTDCEQAVCETQRAYQLDRFHTAALPFYAVIDPVDDTVLATHPDMSKKVEDFVAFLDKGLSAFEKKTGSRKKAPETAAADAGAPEEKRSTIRISPSGAPVDFTFPGLMDQRVKSLSTYRGGWVFLNFWASWCAPCKDEITKVFPEALERAPHISLVTVAFDGDDTKEAALAFAKSAGLPPRSTFQGGEDITEAGLPDVFNVSENLPISYLIHPDGHIAWQHAGVVDVPLLTRLFSMAGSSAVGGPGSEEGSVETQ